MTNPIEYILRLTDQFTGPMKKAEASAKDLESGLNKIGSTIKAIGAIAAVGFAVDKIRDFANEASEAYESVEFAQSQLRAGLASTGMAAGITYDQLTDSAKKFSHELKFTKAQVMDVQSQLLTFTDVGKDLFDQTTKAALDMATRLGGDPKQQMIMLGKALQDPEKGISALHRVGVNTDELAKKFANVTDKVQRQKLILQELETEFGGSAAAAAQADVGFRYNKSIEEAKVNMGELLDKIDEKLSPMKEWVANIGLQAIEKLSAIWGWIEENIDFTAIKDGMVAFFEGVYNFIQPLFEPIKRLFLTMWNGIKSVWAALSQFSTEGSGALSAIQTALGYIIDGFSWLYTQVYNTITMAIDVIHTLWVILQKLHIIDFLVFPFKMGWNILKTIGGWIKSFYDSTLKPIIDAVVGAYEKFKAFLGIKDTVEKAKPKTATGGKAKEEDPLQAFIDKAAAGGKGKMEGITPTAGKSDASKVTGTKATTINIKIDKLIEQFKIETMQMTEGAGRVKELVAQAILEAVRDSQITAGM